MIMVERIENQQNVVQIRIGEEHPMSRQLVIDPALRDYVVQHIEAHWSDVRTKIVERSRAYIIAEEKKQEDYTILMALYRDEQDINELLSAIGGIKPVDRISLWYPAASWMGYISESILRTAEDMWADVRQMF